MNVRQFAVEMETEARACAEILLQSDTGQYDHCDTVLDALDVGDTNKETWNLYGLDRSQKQSVCI